jgi:hypothetical protein
MLMTDHKDTGAEAKTSRRAPEKDSATDDRTALDPRWKISPLIAALSLLAALVAGIALASFLISRGNRNAETTAPVPRTSASDGLTGGAQPEVLVTPGTEVPTIPETDTPPGSSPSAEGDRSDQGFRDTDREAREDEERERDKRDDEREREEAKRDAEREREERKREEKQEREERKRDRKRDKDRDRDDRDGRGTR